MNNASDARGSREGGALPTPQKNLLPFFELLRVGQTFVEIDVPRTTVRDPPWCAATFLWSRAMNKYALIRKSDHLLQGSSPSKPQVPRGKSIYANN